jgi:ABC-type xylose transport system substrate-binding protein
MKIAVFCDTCGEQTSIDGTICVACSEEYDERWKAKVAALEQQLEAERAKKLVVLRDNMNWQNKVSDLEAELEAERAKVANLMKGLRNVLYQGHDLDCLLCGFKDRIAADALAALQAPEVK